MFDLKKPRTPAAPATPRKKAATSKRPSRRRLVPPRALIGLALIGVSLSGVWWVVNETNHLRPYLVVTSEVPVGTPVSELDVDVVYLASPGSPLNYLTPEDAPDHHGLVTTQKIPVGSLVNKAVLEAAQPDDQTLFTTTLDIGGAPWLVPGAVVDVWVAAPLADQAYSVPAVIAASATVSAVRVDDGFAADPSRVSVDLRVHHRDIAELIHARANDYSIQLSPVSPHNAQGVTP